MLLVLVSLVLALQAFDIVIAQGFLSFQPASPQPDAPHPLTTATLVSGRFSIPFGRAAILGPISGACSLQARVSAHKGTLDVAILPAAEWRQWAACRADLQPQRVVCRAQRACDVVHHAVDRLGDTVLLVGRSRIGTDADATVMIRVTGSAAGCPGEACHVLRPPPGQTMQRAVPHLSRSLQRREVPQCRASEALCWLNDTSTRSFMGAARQLGIGLHGVAHASMRGVRGIAARRDLKPNAVVMTVPRAAALEVPLDRNGSSPLPAAFVSPEFWALADEHTRLALVLLWEKRLGDASPRAGLLADLPAGHDPPWRWDPKSLALLHYSPLAYAALQQRAQWRQALADLHSTTPGTNITSAPFYWALETVKSRAFVAGGAGPGITAFTFRAVSVFALFFLSRVLGENGRLVCFCAMAATILQGIVGTSSASGQQALCLSPGVDLVNHAAQPGLVTSEAGYNQFRERFQVNTLKHVPAGSQLFNSYGPRSNDNLLLGYSMVAQDNPDDEYVLDNLLQRLRALQHVSHSRLALLSDLGLADASTMVAVKREGFGGDARAALRAVYAPPQMLAGATAETFEAPLPAEQEAQVEAALHALLVAERDSKPSSLEEDEALVASAAEMQQLGPRAASALLFRTEKKKLLAAAIVATQPSGLGN